jgi:hypothetical protein
MEKLDRIAIRGMRITAGVIRKMLAAYPALAQGDVQQAIHFEDYEALLSSPG